MPYEIYLLTLFTSYVKVEMLNLKETLKIVQSQFLLPWGGTLPIHQFAPGLIQLGLEQCHGWDTYNLSE